MLIEAYCELNIEKNDMLKNIMKKFDLNEETALEYYSRVA